VLSIHLRARVAGAKRRRIGPVGRWSLLLVAVVAPAAAAELEQEAREIVARRCLGCHGPTSRVAGLDLSTRETALRGAGRGPALKPGAADESLLLTRVDRGEMPPTGPLPAEERQTLRRWIDAGAVWSEAIAERRAGKDWWSLQPLRTFPASSSIDGWVSAALGARGLPLSPEADRRTLLRRLTFDLIGLPPSPGEIDDFLGDARPDAYERLVDRLLAAPQYGERWARHWLDVVRYAESEGFERDLLRPNVWPYRDYVIRSLNADKPYLEFAREQIAGDVMEPATRDGIIASSFLVLGPVDAVGLTSAVEAERELVRQDYLEDMVGVVGQTFLGLTVNCARCHDHKFDPIPQEDFYRMKAAFEAVWPPTAGEELYPGSQPLLTPPEAAARGQRLAPIRRRIRELEDAIAALYHSARPALPESPRTPVPVARWTFDVDARDQIGDCHATLSENAELRAGRLRAAKGKETVTLSTPPLGRDVREKTLEAWLWIDTLPEKALTVLDVKNQSGFRGAAVDGIRYAAAEKRQWQNASTAMFRTADVGGAKESAQGGERVQIAIVYGADDTIRLYRNGEPYGRPYKPEIGTAAGHLQTYSQGDAIVRFGAGAGLELDEARLYAVALTEPQVASSFAAGAPSYPPERLEPSMTAGQRERLQSLRDELAHRRAELKAVPETEQVHSPSIGPARATHLLARGDVSRKGAEVTAGAPSCIRGLDPDLGLSVRSTDAERRRRLAEWIAGAQNPLFARVIVNRVWQHHFGAGLVDSPNDFGFNGGKPSHPELLDWLAGEFIREGWSLKRLHRKIVLSRTYRQSSGLRAAATSLDADNRLLWRFAPRRLEGEVVRDAMLVASGKLNPKIGGPSFQPFEAHAQGAYQNWKQKDADTPDFDRRTIYRMNVNSAGDPMLESLDCPVPSVKTPKRASTTTALQALSLMNSAFANRMAKAFADRVAREAGPGAAARVERAFRLALGRPPTRDERKRSRDLAARFGLEQLCWGLFNTSEFLHVD
jgi:mono/diheme cytochrome c family protein